MDHAAQAKVQQIIQQAKKVRAAELITALNQYAPHIKVLSLDCFDTIVWRKAATPKDVFYDLQKKPTFQELGINASLRASAEGRARLVNTLRRNSSEVTLEDIFREAFPNITPDQIEKLTEEELEAEFETCYSFPATVELIREAKRLGIKIIVVSDTYLNEKQLRRLLNHTLPQDAVEAISQIFCSSEFGTSKMTDLFPVVLKELKCQPESILHIGDHPVADYAKPFILKLKALLFMHHEDYVTDLMRLQETSAKIIDPAVTSSRSMAYPFRGVFANNPLPNNPETLVGYTSLGPIMFAFAKFICDEINKVKETTQQEPKVIFLMRDAYLPSLACEAFTGTSVGKRVRISRFASYAASFCSLEDIDNYLIEVGKTNRYEDVSRQLLLPDKVSEPLIKIALRSSEPEREFLQLVRRQDIARITLTKSAEYRKRLLKHIVGETGLKEGDTLMLVDLGYSGTAQRRLTPVFKEMNVNVIGRYLISLRVPGWQETRKGLLDPSWCDDKAMHSLVFYIMLLEQLCTSNESSVIDYDENGKAIYSDVVLSDQQHQKLASIQAECIRFINDAKQFFASIRTTISDEALRQTALAELSRLIFLPTETELQYLKTFQAEMNLGTEDILKVFDPEQGLTGLRRRGMFYMEKPSKTTRTNYPAELRAAGMELALSLIAQHRFGLDLKLKDMALRKEPLTVVFKQGTESFKTNVEAVATHDGFYAIWLPTNLQMHILFGEHYKWLQIESAELITIDAFVTQNETQKTHEAWPFIKLDQINPNSGNLFELSSTDSAIIVNPVVTQSTDFVLRIVFRPIVKHTDQAFAMLQNAG